MIKNILKKFIVLLSLCFILFGFRFTFAEVVPPDLTPVSIHLKVISGTNSLYDNDISVIPCDSEGDGVIKATPYCALTQASIPSDWSGLWINSID